MYAFVGRAAELSVLSQVFERAASGTKQLVLVSGDAGYGKSALVEHFVASGDLGRVGVGRAWESGGAPPLWPWIEAVRAAGETEASEALRTLQPEPGDPSLCAPYDRFSLFVAVASALADLSRAQPLTLVLEDLHAADTGSLLLANFVAAAAVDVSLLVIVTARRTADVADDNREALATLDRAATAGVELGALSREDVAALAALRLERSVADGEVDVLMDTTEGHPLFVSELIDLARRNGSAVTGQVLPRRIRQALVVRLSRLSEVDTEVLQAAAVLGRSFDIELVEHVVGRAGHGALMHAVEEDVLRPVDATTLTFSHILLRDEIYRTIPPARRRELHGHALEAVEALRPASRELLKLRALHALAAPDSVRRDRGLALVAAAADGARAVHAYEEAAELYRRAVDVAAESGASDVHRAELLLAAGETNVRAGKLDVGRSQLVEAFELSRAVGAVAAAARAAEWYAGFVPEAGVVDPMAVQMLETALASSDIPSAVRARLLGRLATELIYDSDLTRSQQLALAAWDIAQAEGELVDRADTALWCATALVQTDTMHDALVMAAEAKTAARSLGDVEVEARARSALACQLMRYGRDVEAREELAWLSRRAHDIAAPLLRWMADQTAFLALMHGQLDDAEAGARDALASAAGQPTALATYIAQQMSINWEKDNANALERPLLTEVQTRPHTMPLVRAAVAAGRAQAGRIVEARDDLRSLVRDLPGFPRNRHFEWIVYWAVETCDVLADRESAGPLLSAVNSLGTPHLLGSALKPSVYLGSADRLRGNLLHLLGRFDEAERMHRHALSEHVRIGAAVFAAHSRFELARTLSSTQDGAGAERSDLLRHVAQSATRGDLRWLQRRLGDVDPRRRATVDAEWAVLERRGRSWSLTLDDRSVSLRDTKGLRMLVRLLTNPGREIRSLDLEPDRPLSPDVGPIIDDQAIRAYRSRVAELRDELDRADRVGDRAAGEKARLELEGLTRELVRASGSGGPRRIGGSSEQARVNVTKRLRATVQRIEEVHPSAGRHLRATLRTGHMCRYDPYGSERQLLWRVNESEPHLSPQPK